MHSLNRRDFLKLSTLAVSGAALAACAAPAAPAPGAAGEQAAEEQALVTYLIRTDIGAAMLEWNDAAAAEFTELRPDIKVEMVGVPWGDYNAKLLAMFAAGTPPEISANYAAGFPTFYANNAIAALDDFVAASDVDLSIIEQAALDAVTREGKLWAMPLAHMPVIVFYNKSMLDEAGVAAPPTDANDTSWTTEEMFETAVAMSHDVADPTAAAWGMVFGPGQLGAYCWGWGIDPFNNQGGPELTEAYQTGKITEAFYNRPEMAEYFQWLVDLTFTHGVAPRPSDTDAITQTVGWPLMSGRVGMFVDGAWQFTNFVTVQPEWEWGAAPLPYGPAGITKPPLFNDSWMLSAGARYPEAGFDFLKYLALENGAKLYAEMTGFFPANKQNYNIFFDSMLSIPNIALSREGLEQVFTTSFALGYPTPGKTLDGYPELNTAFNQTTAPIWNNETPVEEGLVALQTQFETIIATKA
jgi:multiple sugar transport system substrate-binding protein